MDAERDFLMYLGLDISTSIIGFCRLNEEGEPEKFSYLDLRKKDKSLFLKTDLLAEWLEDEICPTDQDTFIIEDKLSGFSGGKTMQRTIITLSTFNAMVSLTTYGMIGKEPLYIHPSTAKALVKGDGLIIPKGANKKRMTVDFVRSFDNFPYVETRNGNPQAYCYDMADAYITVRAGYLKFACEESKS